MILKTCFFLLINYRTIRTQEPDATTLKTIIIETTTELVTIITDIPQSDVELAMNIDYGRYTTMAFNYIRSQYDKLEESDRCFDDYIRCLDTVSVPAPVCSVNNPYKIPDGYKQFNSYCDAYYDNCLRRMRYWRILNYGKCVHTTRYREFNIFPTRKRMKNKVRQTLH